MITSLFPAAAGEAQAGGSVAALARFAQKGGLQGLRAVWPWPSAEAASR